jgi:hypothetical protein
MKALRTAAIFEQHIPNDLPCLQSVLRTRVALAWMKSKVEDAPIKPKAKETRMKPKVKEKADRGYRAPRADGGAGPSTSENNMDPAGRGRLFTLRGGRKGDNEPA